MGRFSDPASDRRIRETVIRLQNENTNLKRNLLEAKEEINELKTKLEKLMDKMNS
jgi:predicted RNase H-like nuclease (RuvC/YqgF family)